MDSLTQIVLGAAVGEAVLGGKVGNKAILYGAIAGTIPDLDIIANYITDTVTAIEIHRGFTHSLVFALVFSPLFGWLISLMEKKSPATWKDWSVLMFWAFFTHALLDAFTTWGTQLFWPFDLRLAFKSIFVIDLLYTIPLLVCLILAMRKKRAASKRRRYIFLGLGISSGYLLLALIFKAIGYSEFKEALANQNIDYKEIQTRPTPFNSIMWSANVETEEAFLLADYSFLDTQPINFYTVPKNHHLLGDLKESDKVKRLIDISEGWYTVSERNGSIFFNDLRFGTLITDYSDPRFVFSYELIEKDSELMVREAPKDREDARILLELLWQRIKGN